jgi:hypothetical protein
MALIVSPRGERIAKRNCKHKQFLPVFVNLPVYCGELLVNASARGSYELSKFMKALGMTAEAPLTRTALAPAHQISRNQHVRGRIILPVVKQVIRVPNGQLIDLVGCPSGSSRDVAIQERPVS